MNSTRRLMLSTIAAGALALTAASVPAYAADPARPGPVTASMVMVAQGAAAGVGYTWGDGLLTFHGHQYRFSVNGVSIADLGYSKVTSKGRVYGLKQLKDFSGTYAAATGQAAAGDAGIGGQILQNANGVQIRIDQVSRGARLQGSVGGITLTLKS